MRVVTEEEAMAREVAADKECGFGDNVARRLFLAGWDAAMEHMAKKAAEGIGHLDKT